MVLGVSVNLLAVLVVSVITMIIGSLWYGPLFGKPWMKMMGFTKASIKKMKMSPATAMMLGFVGTLLTNFVLGVIVGLAGAVTLGQGAMVGFWVWLGIAMPLHAGVFLWDNKPFNLFFLNTIQYLVAIVIAASILAVWA